MIHVCFCFHDKTGRYAKFVGTAMLSLFKNTDSEVTVHLLHDNTLTQENRDKFIALTDRYNQQVEFYNVGELCAEKLKEYISLFPAMKNSRVTLAAFFKFLIPDVLSSEINKCIYLDADIIVNLDIKELWQFDLGEKPIATANEMELMKLPLIILERYLVKNNYVAYEDYFNSGVILIDLNRMRQSEEFIIDAIKFRGEHPCDFFDQDIWNYIFSKNYSKLPKKFNFFVDQARNTSEFCPAIYHYVGFNLQLDMKDLFNRLWMNYFIETPWFDTNTIMDNLYGYVLKLSEDHLAQMKKFSATLSGKTRTFIVNQKNSERVKKEFFVRDDEEIIVVEKNALNQELIDKIKYEHKQKVFFGFISGFPEVLKKEGLIEGEDFFNGSLFFPDVWRYFKLEDGYQIIKDM